MKKYIENLFYLLILICSQSSMIYAEEVKLIGYTNNGKEAEINLSDISSSNKLQNSIEIQIIGTLSNTDINNLKNGLQTKKYDKVTKLNFSTVTFSDSPINFSGFFSNLKCTEVNFPSNITQETNMEKIFQGCSTISGIVDLSGFKNIIDFSEGFKGCPNVKGVRFSDNQYNGVKITMAFTDCTNLEFVEMPGWSIFTIGSDLFNNCQKLVYVMFGTTQNLQNAFSNGNQNCLKYFDYLNKDINTDNFTNIIVNGKTRSDLILDITQNKPYYCPKSFTISTGYKSTFKILYSQMDDQKVYRVPFACFAPEQVDAYQYVKQDTKYAYFNHVKTLNSQECYLFKFKKAGVESLEGIPESIVLPTTAENESDLGYTTQEITLSNIGTLNGNTFTFSNKSVVLKPFSPFLKNMISNGNNAKVTITLTNDPCIIADNTGYYFSSITDNSSFNINNFQQIKLTGEWKDHIDKLKQLITKDNTHLNSSTLLFDMSQITLGSEWIDLCDFFKDHSSLEYVYLPISVDNIYFKVEGLFSGCKKLKEVDLSSFKKIDNLGSTFLNCEALEKVILPSCQKEGSKIVMWSSFEGCTSLKSIDISNWNLLNLNNTFNNCLSLEELKLPLTNILGDNKNESLYRAFYKCKSLKSSIDLRGWENISEYKGAFEDCKNLTSIFLPSISYFTDNTTDKIFESAFKGLNPNCLVSLYEEEEIPDYAVTAELNIINNNKLHRSTLNLSDENPYHAPFSYEVDDVVYTRQIPDHAYLDQGQSSQWETIILPFDAILYADESPIYPFMTNQSGGSYWLRKLIPNNLADEVSFTAVEKNYIEANIPYIIAYPGDRYNDKYNLRKKKLSFRLKKETDGIILPISSSEIHSDNNYDFQGIYQPINDASSLYIIAESGDIFMKQNDKQALPFRCFFEEKTSTPSKILRFGTHVANPLEEIEEEEPVFFCNKGTLYGILPYMTTINLFSNNGVLIKKMRLDSGNHTIAENLEKGIYIINNQKIVIW